MRNLKKILALVLALVMSFSIMTVASAKDFKDVDETNNYAIAIEVLSEIGVLKGEGGNKFNPTGELTRAAGAKIITYMMIGEDAAEALPKDASVFSDVAAGNWAAGYISYAYSAGIINGEGGGIFNPDGPLTGYAFGKMVLTALGVEGKFTGSTWEINVASALRSNGLLGNLTGLTLSTTMTREKAAQLAFNGLTYTTTVGGGYGLYADGVLIETFDSLLEATMYKSILEDGKTEYTVGKVGSSNTLLYRNFGVVENEADTDTFGRPSLSYKDGRNIALVYPYTATLTVAGENYNARTLANFTNAAAVEAAAPVYNNGDAGKALSTFRGKRGVTIEVYASNRTITDVIVTEPYVAQVTNVAAQKDGSTNVTFGVYEAGYYIKNSNYPTITVNSKKNPGEYALVADYAKGTVFMGYFAPNWESLGADALLDVDDVEALTGTVTSISGGAADNYSNWVAIDGTRYKFANEYSQAEVKYASSGFSGTFYLHEGYVVHFTKDTATVDTDYAYVVRVGESGGIWQDEKTLYAELVFSDGTSAVVTYDSDDTIQAGDVVEYYVDGSLYVLGQANITERNGDITRGKANLTTGVNANNSTVFVAVTLRNGALSSVNTYVGVRNVPSMKTNGWMPVVGSNGIASVVFVEYAGPADGGVTDKDMIYVSGDSLSGPVTDASGTYYTFDAVVDGAVTEIKVDANSVNGLGGLYKTGKVNSKGVYTFDANDKVAETISGAAFIKASDGVVTIGDKSYTYADNVMAYLDNGGVLTEFDLTSESFEAVTAYITTDRNEMITTLFLVVE